MVADYVRKGGADLGVTHKTTDVTIGGPGTPQVSVVTVDLEASSYNKVVPPTRQNQLTSVLTSKAWKSATDRKAGTPRIVHLETYGQKPTAAQTAAIEAAIQEAASWDNPVQIIWSHRR